MNIIFYKASYGDIFDKLIAVRTFGPYSHCELMFSDGACFSSSPRDGGTRFKHIDISPTHWDSIPVETDKENRIRCWCAERIGLPYDWWGILGLSFGQPNIQNKKKLYCSEVCIEALKSVGIIDFKSSMSPNRFYRKLNRLVQGRVNNRVHPNMF